MLDAALARLSLYWRVFATGLSFTVFGVGGLLMVALVGLFLRARELGPLRATGGTLLIGGGLSNWFDRLMNDVFADVEQLRDLVQVQLAEHPA